MPWEGSYWVWWWQGGVMIWKSDQGIILPRNPLSGRNPGISPRRFEIPPPSTFRSCLSMLLETDFGDCSSICRAPAICPTVSQAHRLAIIILHHHHYVLDTKSILRCGYNDCLATIMMPTTTWALPLHRVASWRMQTIACVGLLKLTKRGERQSMTHQRWIQRADQDHKGWQGERKAILKVEELIFSYEVQVTLGGSVVYVARKATCVQPAR